MAQYSCDVLIKKLREQRNMTQKELSEGICTRDTLSRIERGERLPTWYVFEKIMQRLGENPHAYYQAIVSAEDKRVLDIKENCEYLSQCGQFSEIERILNSIENEPEFQSGINLQWHLMGRAMCNVNLYKDMEAAYKFIMEAIKITKPLFSEDEIDNYILTNTEATCINTLAIIQDKRFGLDRATSILLKLKASIDNNYINETEKKRMLPMILSNVSRNLKYLQRYDECLEICDQGIAYSEKCYESYYYPKFVINKSHCLYLLDRNDEAADCLRQACLLYAGLKRYAELDSVKNYFKENLNVVVDIVDYSVVRRN